MNRNWIVRMLALALALMLALVGAAEELGEMDLYDPSIYVDDGSAAPNPQPSPASEGPAPALEAEPEEYILLEDDLTEEEDTEASASPDACLQPEEEPDPE